MKPWLNYALTAAILLLAVALDWWRYQTWQALRASAPLGSEAPASAPRTLLVARVADASHE